MKSLVVYYSHYGNTSYVADKIAAALHAKGEVTTYELEYVGGKKSMLRRFFYRLMPSLVKLSADTPLDVSAYDILCLAVPVIAGQPPAIISRFISASNNIGNKQIICCFVYGIEISAKLCFQRVNKLLKRRGAHKVIDMYVPWLGVHNEKLLDKAITGALGKIA